MTGSAPTAAFDRLAARYDELWTNTPVGEAQRRQVWRQIDRLFHPGERLLDLGCGTGADAAHFYGRGLRVHATDNSSAMVEAARRRGGFTAEVLRLEDAGRLHQTFDGVLSNFGAFNCVADLSAAARGLSRVLGPGGCAAICIIGRFCVWETLYYAARLQFAKARRRWRGSAASSLGIAIHYPTVAQMEAAFAPHFELRRWTGVGLFVPPSYVPLPAPFARFAAMFDSVLARLPVLRALCDHRLLIFVRK